MTAIAASSLRVLRPRGIWGFVLRRVLLGLVTLFLVSVIVFGATQALPSDPARAFLGRTAFERVQTAHTKTASAVNCVDQTGTAGTASGSRQTRTPAANMRKAIARSRVTPG